VVSADAVLAILQAEPRWRGDRSLSADIVLAAEQPYAEAIADESKTLADAAALLTILIEETHGATPVLLGHCDQMPEGERCDNLRARGGFQLHREACRAAYAYAAGSVESIRAEAHCALGHLHHHARVGREHAQSPMHAAFCGYGARSYSCGLGDTRAKTYKRVLAALRRQQ